MRTSADGVSVTNPKGAVQKREYDPVGRVVRVLDFDGNDIRLSYDGIDNLTEYRDNVQQVEYGSTLFRSWSTATPACGS